MEDVEQEVEYLMCWAVKGWGQMENSTEQPAVLGRNILESILTSHAGPLRNTPLFIQPISSNLVTGEVEHAPPSPWIIGTGRLEGRVQHLPGRHIKCQHHCNQLLCTIFRAWVNFSTSFSSIKFAIHVLQCLWIKVIGNAGQYYV